MTEQELKEKMAKQLRQHTIDSWYGYLQTDLASNPPIQAGCLQERLSLWKSEPQYIKDEYLVRANQILAIIKGAGWKSREEIQKSELIWQEQVEHARDGYAKLAKDQTLPQSIENEFLGTIVVMGVETMRKEWRKVELKG